MSDLLYVCSPYRGDTKRNKEYARKVMLYEQDDKIYLVDSREETTGGQDNE